MRQQFGIVHRLIFINIILKRNVVCIADTEKYNCLAGIVPTKITKSLPILNAIVRSKLPVHSIVIFHGVQCISPLLI